MGIINRKKNKCYKLIGYPPNYNKTKYSSTSVNYASFIYMYYVEETIPPYNL